MHVRSQWWVMCYLVFKLLSSLFPLDVLEGKTLHFVFVGKLEKSDLRLKSSLRVKRTVQQDTINVAYMIAWCSFAKRMNHEVL